MTDPKKKMADKKRVSEFNRATFSKNRGSTKRRCVACGGTFVYNPPMTWHWHASGNEKPCTGELVKL